jgi:hypothetical protein
VSYLELITSYLHRSDASLELITVVEDYLEHGSASDDPPWDTEYDEVVAAAVRYANSKRFRFRRFQKALNARHAASLEQEASAIRRALKGGNSTKKARQTMIQRLQSIEQLVADSKKEAK